MDGNGFITRDELSNVLLVLGCGDDDAMSSPNPALRLESVFEAMDTNMDGLISFAEFKVMFRCFPGAKGHAVSQNYLSCSN
jgi:Ca2+-binding EF-hand superfamily protein